MKTLIRNYKRACDFCNATGFVSDKRKYTTSMTKPCPVCNGEKTINITETEIIPDTYEHLYTKPYEVTC